MVVPGLTVRYERKPSYLHENLNNAKTTSFSVTSKKKLGHVSISALIMKLKTPSFLLEAFFRPRHLCCGFIEKCPYHWTFSSHSLRSLTPFLFFKHDAVVLCFRCADLHSRECAVLDASHFCLLCTRSHGHALPWCRLQARWEVKPWNSLEGFVMNELSLIQHMMFLAESQMPPLK